MTKRRNMLLVIITAIQPLVIAFILLFIGANKHTFGEQEYLNAVFGLSILANLGLTGLVFAYIIYTTESKQV